MAATSIYNIDYPLSTDLVTAGATQMQTLAGDVETALQAQVQSMSAGFRNQLRNPTFSQAQLPTATVGIADYWQYYTDSITGVTNTRNTLAVTTGLPEWVSGSMTQATASNAAGVNRYVALQQSIPDVRTLSGQTVIVSFYAKAATGTPKVGVNLTQTFGTGGTPSADVVGTGQAVTLSTSWARYNLTFTVASASGKTLGTNGDDATILRLWTSAGTTYNTPAASIGLQTSSIDVTGIQVELSYLTPLEIRNTERNWEQSSRFGVWNTWSPVLTQTNTPTQTVQYAVYTVIGKLCVAECQITLGAAGTASGVIRILSNGTLPAPKDTGGPCGWLFGNWVGLNTKSYMAHINAATPDFNFYDPSTTTGNITTPTMASGYIANLQVMYPVA